MGEFLKAAKLQDIEEGKGIHTEISGKPVALFKIEGRIYATGNTCPHRGGPLGEGECDGTVVTCPWHGWQFDVATGCNPDNPNIKIQTYPVKIQGDEVWVEV
ncbi:MAG: Rieske (2Fe-2S) protein [Candidatus Binatia bacterium]